MKKYIFISVFVFAVSGFLVFAQQGDPFADITYPIPELGNCIDKEDCLNYCDDSDNMEPCLDFAETHNLIPEEEIAIARKMLAAGETEGPGGCQGQAECEVYCDDISHIRECIAFAEEHDLIPEDELEEARKVADALDQGLTPPNNCTSKEDCDVYCSQPANMKECVTFAKAAGLIPPEELEEVEKVLAAIEKGVTPPPCGGKDECDEYCALPENLETCITFAEAAGFMSPEEAAMVRRTGGQGPGGCRGRDECEQYCEDPANMEPCINFAIENGFMSPEEAEQAKKMLAAGFTSGPGGCKGQEECETYCDDMSHMAECVDFAEKAGFMSSEDAVRARKMAEMGISGGPGGCKGEEECQSFCEDPANMETCLNFAVQIGDMDQEEAEEMRGNMEMMMQGGPGGCTSEEECVAYCEDPAHGIECINFSVQIGQMSPEEAQQMLEMMQGGGGMMPPEGFEGEMPEGMMPPEGFEGEMPEGMMPEGMMPEGMMPEEFEEQFQEQFQQEFERQSQEQMQQQIEQQMQQQIQQQMEQMMPPPQEPQSFFDQIKNFLAGLVPEM